MSENHANQNNLIDTTDCLEAVGVFRGWKNFLFLIVMLCLILLQTSFWLVDTGWVKAAEETKSGSSVVLADGAEQVNAVAKALPSEPNQPAEAAAEHRQQEKAGFNFFNKFKHWALLIRIVDFILILAAVLYCLTMLFSLKVSLLGRLGGINHISRAFFLSLLMLVLILPWQSFFAGVVVGLIYTPGELLSRYSTVETSGFFGTVFYYLRFVGYWLLVLLLLIFSYLRSCRWAKAILRRLEVI